MNRPLAALAATLLTALLLTAGDGTSMAGIQGSGRTNVLVRGQITQFGSIFVNGVEYDTAGAQVHFDGAPGPDSKLRVGQVVTVRAEVNDDGTGGVATDVAYASNVLGPLAQVDLAGGTLVILGQRIRLLGDTFLDPSLPLGGILGLVPGIKLQVSGFPNAAGDIVASRIDLVLGGSTTPRIQGVVQALNPGAHTFRLNTQTVNYGGVTPVGTLANGSTVAVEGNVPFGQSSLLATRVEIVSGIGGIADERGDVQGLITAFTSATDFAIGAQRVTTNVDTNFALYGKVLGPNLRVVVRGFFDAAGVLVAQDVEASSSEGVGAQGAVQAVSGHSLRVSGVNFDASSTTAFDDASNQGLRTFGLADVRVGDYVEVRGASGAAAPQATVIKRSDARSDGYLEGKTQDLALPNFRVLNVQVITTPQTRYPTSGLLASLKFFLLGPNQLVRVRGTLSGNTLVAEQIDLVK